MLISLAPSRRQSTPRSNRGSQRPHQAKPAYLPPNNQPPASAIRFRRLHLDERPEPAKVAASLQLLATVNLYLDTYYGYSFNQPRDDTIVGSDAVGRNTEWQINNATIGVETNYKNVLGKITLQAGNQLAVTQDLDGTVNRGRDLSVANNKYIGEALGGYHFNHWNGVNVEAGYFYSCIGLESYLLGENWNYNRSFLSDLTPFYFSGARVQIFPTDKIKIEPWFMNGYQTYGKWSKNNSIGLSNYWRPNESLGFVANFYYGTDTRETHIESDSTTMTVFSSAISIVRNQRGSRRWR
jgi:hypothetical protein